MQFSTIFLAAVAAVVASALPSPSPDFSGRGSPTFNNVGKACTVGNQSGTCDRFGRCGQFIPPNETSFLNRGDTVAACTAGGQSGTA